MADERITDEWIIADFVKRYGISETEDFWGRVEQDAMMSKIMADDPDGSKLQYASGRIAEEQIRKERAHGKDKAASGAAGYRLQDIYDYCMKNGIYLYDRFVKHAKEHEPGLSAYAAGLDNVPLGRTAVVRMVQMASAAQERASREFWENAGVPVDSDGEPLGAG